MDKFNFTFYGNIHFGVKSRSNLDSILKDNGYRSACIIIDHALLSVPIFNNYIAELQCDVKIIECDISEPTYDKLEEKRAEIKDSNFDIFIGTEQPHIPLVEQFVTKFFILLIFFPIISWSTNGSQATL